MDLIFPNIPKITFNERNPETINVVQYWGFFTHYDLENNGTHLMMMDIDFGRSCTLRCPTCFRKDNFVDDGKYKDLSYEKLISIILEAKDLGLKQIKICGAGEPLENPKILQLAEDLSNNDIGLGIFTKGHVLGDDSIIKKIYKQYGITNGHDLCAELFDLKTSFLVSFQSANPNLQDHLVGDIKGYSIKRNRGIELLANAGFNECLPTRLAMCANPITKENKNEMFDIYVYAREHNILPIIAALMISGNQIDGFFLKNYDISEEDKIDLYTKIYKYNLFHRYNKIDDLMNDDISCMPGIHPCNQIASGMYLTCNGNVIRCPGDDGKILGNVNEKSISEIWTENRNWDFLGKYNCRCPFKDGITIPLNLYDKVLSNLMDN